MPRITVRARLSKHKNRPRRNLRAMRTARKWYFAGGHRYSVTTAVRGKPFVIRNRAMKPLLHKGGANHAP